MSARGSGRSFPTRIIPCPPAPSAGGLFMSFTRPPTACAAQSGRADDRPIGRPRQNIGRQVHQRSMTLCLRRRPLRAGALIDMRQATRIGGIQWIGVLERRAGADVRCLGRAPSEMLPPRPSRDARSKPGAMNLQIWGLSDPGLRRESPTILIEGATNAAPHSFVSASSRRGTTRWTSPRAHR